MVALTSDQVGPPRQDLGSTGAHLQIAEKRDKASDGDTDPGHAVAVAKSKGFGGMSCKS